MKISQALRIAAESPLEPLRHGVYFSADGRSCVIGGICKVLLGDALTPEMIKQVIEDHLNVPDIMQKKLLEISNYEVSIFGIEDFFDGARITLDQMSDLYNTPKVEMALRSNRINLLAAILILNDGLKWPWNKIATFVEANGY